MLELLRSATVISEIRSVRIKELASSSVMKLLAKCRQEASHIDNSSLLVAFAVADRANSLSKEFHFFRNEVFSNGIRHSFSHDLNELRPATRENYFFESVEFLSVESSIEDLTTGRDRSDDLEELEKDFSVG
jgi:hypothetical protein